MVQAVVHTEDQLTGRLTIRRQRHGRRGSAKGRFVVGCPAQHQCPRCQRHVPHLRGHGDRPRFKTRGQHRLVDTRPGFLNITDFYPATGRGRRHICRHGARDQRIGQHLPHFSARGRPVHHYRKRRERERQSNSGCQTRDWTPLCIFYHQGYFRG